MDEDFQSGKSKVIAIIICVCLILIAQGCFVKLFLHYSDSSVYSKKLDLESIFEESKE